VRAAVLLCALWLAGLCPAQEAPPAPPAVKIGGVTLRPGGFIELIGETRSARTTDSVSTRFGNIPLDATPSESLVSARHSRLLTHAGYTRPGLSLTGFFESDFLNAAPGRSPYRWRQYWGRIQLGKWELLGGQAWSLLRPNRRGTASDRDVMNTDVVDPAYHVGLIGSRRRQVRLGRIFGDYQAVAAWETQGNFLAKVTADKPFGHLEAAAFTGRSGRRGVSVAAVLNLAPRFRFITQEYWSRRAAFEALNVVPKGPGGTAAIQGLEFRPSSRFEIYSYAGLVYASHTSGNRLVSEWTVGVDYRTPVPAIWGALVQSVQYSTTDRFAWTGRSGEMHFLMYRLRYTLR
jgi:hypothetical protein